MKGFGDDIQRSMEDRAICTFIVSFEIEKAEIL